MATLAQNNVTLADWAKRLDPDGNTADIVEILMEENAILDDMVWKEGNLPTGHRTTMRSGLPSGTWRKLYQGVDPTKSTTVQVTDTCGMLEAYAEVDKRLADLNGNTAEFRLSEDRAFVQGLSEDMASTLFYGDTDVNPERFMGFSERYNSLSAGNSGNIIDAGGTGSDNQSIWLINWGDDKCHGIFPKGSKAGLSMEDKGQVTLDESGNAGARFEGYRTHYSWDAGLSLRNWKYVVRIANIDTSLLTADISTGANLNDLMIQAQETIQNANGAVFYMTKYAREMLRRQLVQTSNVQLQFDTSAGKRVADFGGNMVKVNEQQTQTEAQIT